MTAVCNIVNMTRLIEALESGEYPQARNYLYRRAGVDVGYCCAGVAARLAEMDGAGSYDDTSDVIAYFTDAGVDPASVPASEMMSAYSRRSRQVMTRGVIAWLGLIPDTNEASANLPAGPTDADWGTTMNDAGHDFTEIATRLREWYGIPEEDTHAG